MNRGVDPARTIFISSMPVLHDAMDGVTGVLIRGLDLREGGAPLVDPGIERAGAGDARQLALHSRPGCVARWPGRRRDGLDPRDGPALLELEWPDDRLDVSLEHRVLEGPDELASVEPHLA